LKFSLRLSDMQLLFFIRQLLFGINHYSLSERQQSQINQLSVVNVNDFLLYTLMQESLHLINKWPPAWYEVC
jgi:hypothetical protein